MTYFELRQRHFTTTLRNWFRGLDKTIIALVAVLQFILTALATVVVMGLAWGLGRFLDPAADLATRAAVVAAWQCASWILLRALAEPAFMPRARRFIDALPVVPSRKMQADLALAALAYSFLWVPVLWILFTPHTGEPGRAALTLAELAGLSLCVNIPALRGAWRHAVGALLALGVFAAIPGQGLVAELARLAATALGATALWLTYLPGARPAALPARASAFADRLALRTGLVLPLLAHELRANLLVRLGLIASTLAACLIVIRLRTNDTSTVSVVVFVAAVATLALYRLPALIRSTLLTKLHFLAGHPEFPRRIRFSTYLLPTALFAGSILAAWPFDRSGTAPRDAGIFAALYLLGVAGARAGFAVTHWLVPLFGAVALIILSAMT
jgi:hypothetical protein